MPLQLEELLLKQLKQPLTRIRFRLIGKYYKQFWLRDSESRSIYRVQNITVG